MLTQCYTCRCVWSPIVGLDPYSYPSFELTELGLSVYKTHPR